MRREVFHNEQGISEADDFDGQDVNADHFVAFDGKSPVGTARVRYIDGAAKVERLAVIKPYRGKGIGEEIMKNLMELLREKAVSEVYLDSQSYASSFYEKFGFQREGDEFEEVGRPHVKMVAKIKE